MGALGARGLRGHKRGRQKERKKERKRNRERERKNKEEKKGKRQKIKEIGGKKDKIKVSQHEERGAMQFQAQAGLKGRKLQGRQIDGEKR